MHTKSLQSYRPSKFAPTWDPTQAFFLEEEFLGTEVAIGKFTPLHCKALH